MEDGEEEQPEEKKKKPSAGLPVLEGPETADAFIAKFKRACLSKRQSLNEVRARLEAEQCASHKTHSCTKGFLYICTTPV